MKIQWIFLFCFLASQSSNAQQNRLWGTIARGVDAKPYAGKKFRIEAAAKTIAIDKNANSEVWVRVDKTNKKMGFFYNMMDKPIVSAEWKVYSISGIIDKQAKSLVFGGMYHERGLFYFDDFKLFIENSSGIMEQMPLVNGDFEEDSLVSKKSWGYNIHTNVYNISLTKDEVYSGKQSCKIDGSVISGPKIFGHNASTGKYANVNGIKIYYEEYGKGQPLILLHGNSSSISLFEKQIPELSKYFHVYAIDTRGQGNSTEDGRTYSYDLFAEDMNALLDYLKLDSVNVLGWSDGGNTGLNMAMKYPAKIKKLITMGANVFIDHSVVDNKIFKILHKEKKSLLNDTFPGSANRLRLIELLLTEPRHNFQELKLIRIPVLIIAGEHDIIKEGHTRSIAANIPGSKLFIAPKETHDFPSENPDLFNRTAIDFLKQ